MPDFEIDYIQTANRIKVLAKQKGVKVSALCAAVGKSHTYLNTVALGKASEIPQEYLTTFAGMLGTTFTYLIGLTDDPSPESSTPFVSDKSALILANVAAMSDEEQSVLLSLTSLPEDDRKKALAVLSALLK